MADAMLDLAARVEADELRHSLRNASFYRGAMIEARLEDAELASMAKDQRRFGRSGL